MTLLKEIFNVFRHPVLFFQFFSHRFLRWTLTPLCLPILLAANILLVFYDYGSFYQAMLIAQVIFYLLALAGNYLKSGSGKFKVLRICHYIFFMNYSVYLGFIRFIRGKQSVMWEKAGREMITASA
jgi:hypothetical protein